MIVIYTSPGCAGCRKLKQWLKDREIEYKEKNIFKVLLSPEEIKYLLMRTDNGAEDIISKRSKVILENHINIDDMTVDELIAEVNEKCEGKPFRRLPLPKDISRRINFQ